MTRVPFIIMLWGITSTKDHDNDEWCSPYWITDGTLNISQNGVTQTQSSPAHRVILSILFSSFSLSLSLCNTITQAHCQMHASMRARTHIHTRTHASKYEHMRSKVISHLLCFVHYIGGSLPARKSTLGFVDKRCFLCRLPTEWLLGVTDCLTSFWLFGLLVCLFVGWLAVVGWDH